MILTVPPEGSPDSKIAFVGEAPAAQEVTEGRPFVGAAGSIFNELLLHAKISRAQVYITNLFKMRIYKKGNDFYSGNTCLYSERSGFTKEGQKHVDKLITELKDTKSNVIVPMGNPALYALTGNREITKRRGSMLWSDVLDRKIIPTIHPAATLRVYLDRHLILLDFTRIRIESEYPELRLPKRHYFVFPTYEEVTSELDYIIKDKPITAVDIEVSKGEVSRIALVHSLKACTSIPFVKEGKEYFTLPQEQEIWHLIAQILEDPKIQKIGQKMDFDCGFMFEKYGIIPRNIDDTLIGQRLMFPDFKAGLDFIASTRTREPYYKDVGKQYWKLGTNEEEFGIYNAKDAVICLEAFPSIISDLKRINNLETYEMQKSLIEPCIFMSQKGLLVDEELLTKTRKEAEDKREELQDKLNSMVGAELNPNSPKQVATYFYIKKGIQPYKEKGKITTNEGALKRIARRGFPEARLILDIRHLTKMIGTYYTVQLKNGRLVCSYNPVTAMGRLSSSEDIFGYGTNLQNQPGDMNKHFVADPGYLLYSIDLSQADNRSVAYMSPEPRMIQAFEDGTDVHSLTGEFIFDIPKDEIKAMDKEGVCADIGNGDWTHRKWAKTANHALNFGLGYRSFSYKFEIPEREGKVIYDRYHATYPGVSKGYWKWIQQQLRQDRILTNAFGRKYLFKDRWGEELFKKAYAFPAQSNTADCINRRGLIPMYYEQEYQDCILLRQVHDSIDFEIPLNIGIDKHIQIIKSIKARLEQPICWRSYEFVIPAEVKCGLRLNPMKELDFSKNLTEQLKEYFT